MKLILFENKIFMKLPFMLLTYPCICTDIYIYIYALLMIIFMINWLYRPHKLIHHDHIIIFIGKIDQVQLNLWLINNDDWFKFILIGIYLSACTILLHGNVPRNVHVTWKRGRVLVVNTSWGGKKQKTKEESREWHTHRTSKIKRTTVSMSAAELVQTTGYWGSGCETWNYKEKNRTRREEKEKNKYLEGVLLFS